MNATERKAAFDKLEGPKPTWETFKRMLTMFDGDIDHAIEKWRNKEWKRKGWRNGEFVELNDE